MTETVRVAALIDLAALESNLRTIRSHLSGQVKALCVVKADAYGHGAIEVSRRLESCGVSYLGVANIDEGIELREHGITLPILIMSGIFSWEEIDRAVRNNLTLVVYDAHTLERIREDCHSFERPLKVHIKVDTGMGRLGFAPSDMAFVGEKLKGAQHVICEGLMTHFAASEVRDDYGLTQVSVFCEAQARLKAAGIIPEIIHMANSGAITSYPEAHFDMVRVGISLYGSHPAHDLAGKLPLRQVMKCVSKVALIREFPAGQPLSYGRTFITGRDTRVAYIPVGYADGYPRSLSNKGFVLIKDREYSIVGIVCMDWTLVDITDAGAVDVGDEVILLGHGDRETITANELAEWAGTIPYEILCKISKRVVRLYV